MTPLSHIADTGFEDIGNASKMIASMAMNMIATVKPMPHYPKGHEERAMELPPILVSVLFLIYVYGICEGIRRFGARYWLYDLEVPYLLNEFSGCLQVCAMVFEIGQILVYYGPNAYTGSLALVIFIHCYTLSTAIANPANYFEMWRQWSISTSGFVAYLAVQIAAGLMAYPVTQVFWHLAMRPDHAWKALHYTCKSPLKVPPFLGMTIEMVASAILRLGTLIICTANPRGWVFLVPCLWALLVRLGMQWTGLYMNPIIALSQTIRCLALWKEILTYWTGPFLGALIGGRLYYAYIYKAPEYQPLPTYDANPKPGTEPTEPIVETRGMETVQCPNVMLEGGKDETAGGGVRKQLHRTQSFT